MLVITGFRMTVTADMPVITVFRVVVTVYLPVITVLRRTVTAFMPVFISRVTFTVQFRGLEKDFCLQLCAYQNGFVVLFPCLLSYKHRTYRYSV